MATVTAPAGSPAASVKAASPGTSGVSEPAGSGSLIAAGSVSVSSVS
jgi:hypothetical protein